MVSNPESLNLDTGNKILYKFDQSERKHLTSVKGGPHEADYKTQKSRDHRDKNIRVAEDHIDIDKGVQKLMKTTTY